MTDSMIPYSFIPGTKAKASEVNANFISLASVIEANKDNANQVISELNTTLKNGLDLKVDKSEYVDQIPAESGTNLNAYKTKGTYIFNDLTIPLNRPQSYGGMEKGINAILIVMGDLDTSLISQTWYVMNNEFELYTRYFKDGKWTEWKPATGKYTSSYVLFPNGLLLQWGSLNSASTNVTFPIAFTGVSSIAIARIGSGTNSSTGIQNVVNTGFAISSYGYYYGVYWIAVGFKEV